MIIPSKFSGYSRDGIRLYPMGGGGGGGPTNSTVTQSNIPEYLRPQVESLLGGAGKELFNYKTVPGIDGAPNTYEIEGTKAVTPYSTNVKDYVAGFSPLQRQVQANAANLQMPDQFNQGSQLAGMAGQGAINSAGQAYGYGNAGFQSGMQGEQRGTQGGEYYGGMGAGYGTQGAQAGKAAAQLAQDNANNIASNAYGYGDMGVGYGAQGAGLGTSQGNFYGAQGAGYGAQGAGYGAQGAGYGDLSSQIGRMGLQAQATGSQVGNQAQQYAAQAAAAGQNYANQATNPAAYGQYMSPYIQNVVDVQNLAAQRNADIASTQRGASAARAGAFGGARQAIENAEANRALQSTMNANQAMGLQGAYQQAQQNMQYGAGLGLQGLQGAQQGLGTALQGGQLGLSGIGTALQGQQGAMQGAGLGIQGAQAGMQGSGMGLQGLQQQLAGTAQGMQGAQIGLSAVDRANAAAQLSLAGTDRQLAGTAQGMQGAQIGLQGVDRQLAGTAQGMQGAGMGLQGVSGAQAGYGLANQSANTLGSLGTQQLAGQTGILGLQNQIGGQQQAQEQQFINQSISNYAQGQNAPMERMNQYNALLRGYALPGTTTTQYQAQPTLANQLAGFGTAGIAAAQLAKKKGGRIHEPKRSGLHTLALRNVMRG